MRTVAMGGVFILIATACGSVSEVGPDGGREGADSSVPGDDGGGTSGPDSSVSGDDADLPDTLTLSLEGTGRQALDDSNDPAIELTFVFDCAPDCDFVSCTLSNDDSSTTAPVNACESPVVAVVAEDGDWTFELEASLGDQTETVRTTIGTSLAPFVSRWDTSISSPGGSNSNQIRLPLVEEGDYHFRVIWGDGRQDVISSFDQVDVTHTYQDEGEYTLTIHGTLEGWVFGDEGDRRKLLEISQWGPLRLGNSPEGYFRGASNLEITAEDLLDLTRTTILARAFEGCRSITSVPRMDVWDVSNVTDMRSMFSSAGVSTSMAFNEDIGGWDVSNVTDMGGMFFNARDFDQDISGWDVSRVTNMGRMFHRASAFNQDISGWDVSNVTDMSQMFGSAITGTPMAFNQDIGGWNVSSVTDMSGMFTNAATFNQDLGRWDVSNVTDMSNMFDTAREFNQNIGGWNVSSVTDMSFMFSNANAFNQNIGEWDVSSVVDMSRMFTVATVFNQDISNWDVSSVTNMSGMFRSAQAFNQPVGSWNTGSLRNASQMFEQAISFDRSLGGWDISLVETLSSMFNNTTLSTATYNATLIGWANQNTPPSVTFDGGSATASGSGITARNTLVNDFGWTIRDGDGNHSP